MPSAHVNKVVYGSSTLIDLTADTVTPATLMQGYTAHDASGAVITGTSTAGTMVIRDTQDSHGGTVREITAGSVVTGTKTITANGTYDVAEYADASVNVPSAEPELQAKTATPTESQQTVTPDSGYDGLSSVTVGAISSTYVGSGITRRSSSDLTASGATVTVPSGYYSAQASKAVSSGTAGTPTATKGSVSNHSLSVTPSVTNATGYITGGTVSGTAVSVSASELVSGTLNITSSGTKDVTNYASASVAAGSATASATKGSVTNHSVTVTPSVTRTAGYVTAGTADGTAVTVSASELVSGSQTITENGTVDVTNLASVDVEVESSGGNHKVTISASSASVNCRVKLNGAGTSYYKNGAEFEFAAGDYIQAYAMGSQGGGEIYVNGVKVAGGQDGATFNYALPPCNVAVSTAYSSTGRVYITTEEPIVIFENGEFTPSEDVTEVSVSFASSHVQPPTIVMVGDVQQNSTSSTSTVENFVFVDEYRLFGGTGRFGTSTVAQGIAGGMYSNSTNSLVSNWNRIDYGSANTSATDSTYSRWWASTTGFRAYLEASRYFRAGRKYAWTAIWTS